MKIGLALIRKQADVYRSQGLHREARELYSRFSDCATQIDPKSKAIVEKQLQLIDLELSCVDPAAPQELSGDQVEIIKKGWGEAESGVDVLVCAQAFMEIGRYGDALEEFRTMIMRGSAYKHLASSIADCFLHLFDFQKLPSEVDSYAKSIYQDQDAVLKFQISIARQLLNRGRSDYALELYRHLCRKPSSSKRVQSRLTALGTMIQAQPALKTANPEPMKSKGSSPHRRSFLFRIDSMLRSLLGGLAGKKK
ncbi:MAG: hypothetical protein R6V84_12895 [Desulfobacterales bacterium]